MADRSGEGWLFAHDGGCAAVTAGHVVAGTTSPLLVNAAGVEGQGRTVATPGAGLQVGGEAMDAALLTVAGGLASGCEDDLGYQDVGPTLARLNREGGHLVLEKLDPRGNLEVVELGLVAVNRDGLRFTVRPLNAADPIAQGDSGSPVLLRSASAIEGGLPLGLITRDLGGGEALVLRMDAIRRWVDGIAAAPLIAPTDATLHLVAWSGVTADPGCGPLNLIEPTAACGWRVAPVAGSQLVTADLALSAPRPGGISSVTMRFEQATTARGIAVAAAAGNNSWASLVYCPVSAGQVSVTCHFAPSAASTYRITVEGLRGGVRTVVLN